MSCALNLSNFCQFEENVDLQLCAAHSVATFAAFSAAPGAPCSTATDKIIKNLGTFLCQNKDYAPIFEEWQSEMEGIPIARQNQILAAAKSGTRNKVPEDARISPEDQKSHLIRRGTQAALSEIAAEFGEKLFNTLPILSQNTIPKSQNTSLILQTTILTLENTILNPQNTSLISQTTILTWKNTILTPQNTILKPQNTSLISHTTIPTLENTILNPQNTSLISQTTMLNPQNTILNMH